MECTQLIHFLIGKPLRAIFQYVQNNIILWILAHYGFIDTEISLNCQIPKICLCLYLWKTLNRVNRELTNRLLLLHCFSRFVGGFICFQLTYGQYTPTDIMLQIRQPVKHLNKIDSYL